MLAATQVKVDARFAWRGVEHAPAEGKLQVLAVAEMNDRIRVGEINLLALLRRHRAQPVENLIQGPVVVPNPGALTIGPGPPVVEGATEQHAASLGPALGDRVGVTSRSERRRRDLVIHWSRQIGHGKLTVAEVPDAAAVGTIHIEGRIVVDPQVLDLPHRDFADAESSSGRIRGHRVLLS